MPLARNLTVRNGSRSPALRSDMKGSSSPRPFLPPSHYAAAAAYGVRSSTHKEYNNAHELKHIMGSSSDSIAEVQESYHNTFMPVSYPSDSEATSNSSFEFKSTFNSRYSSSSEQKRSSSSRSGSSGKFQSHITGLPELEAHLLPSLRDTIDRMTRPPSRVGSPPRPESVFNPRIPKSSNNILSSQLLPPLDSATLEAKGLSVAAAAHSYYHAPSTSEPSEIHLDTAVTPLEMSTSRTNLPVKSSLKSALRPPTPKLFSGTSPSPGHSPQPSPGGVSLKSVRSILRRKTSSSSLASPFTPGSEFSRKSKQQVRGSSSVFMPCSHSL